LVAALSPRQFRRYLPPDTKGIGAARRHKYIKAKKASENRVPKLAQMAETPERNAAKAAANAELVHLAINGDRAAFAGLLAENYDFIFRVAYKWCGSKEDAEDITQEVCIKLARIIKTYDGRARFSSWLYRVVLNAVRDLQRAKMRRSRRAQELKHTQAQAVAPSQESETLQSQIWSAVRQLPERQRDAMLLVYGEQMAHAEAARVMNCREATVSGHVHAAKKTLKKLL